MEIGTKKLAVFLFMLFCVVAVNAQVYSSNSYHFYTSDEDKYLESNVQNDSLKICIEETNQDIELSIYNHVADKWMTFDVKIDYKLDIGFKSNIGTLYVCTNNTNQTCGVCIVNTDEGTLIDLHHFFVGEQALSCWVKSEKK